MAECLGSDVLPNVRWQMNNFSVSLTEQPTWTLSMDLFEI